MGKIRSALAVGGPSIRVLPIPIHALEPPGSNQTNHPADQSWFDDSQNPPVKYTFNGKTWITIGYNAAAITLLGSSTLALGTVTIPDTSIAAGDKISLNRTSANASTTLGQLSYTIIPGVSFTVTSLTIGTPGATQTADVSSFSYTVLRPQ